MNRKDIESKLTALVIDQLRNGKVPWLTPWATDGYLPTSLQTGKPYNGINRFLLSMLGGIYSRPLWVTFLQAKQLGGTVRKGERGVPIVYYNRVKKTDLETGESYTIPLLRLSTVFNVDQCSDIQIPAKFLVKREPVAVLDAVQTLLDKYTSKPPIYYTTGDRAYYVPMLDSITLPTLEQFKSPADYAHTLAHELTHSTGHASRLNRKNSEPAPFGSPVYAKEELVAEIGAVMVLSELGMNIDMTQNASYLAGWLGALENDTSMLLTASAQAQKACDYMLGITRTADETVSETEEVLV